MGRHRLRPVPHPRRTAGPAGRHRSRSAPSRLAAPAALTAVLLVAGPAGTALADAPPPAPGDEAGTLLGSVLGTDEEGSPEDTGAANSSAGDSSADDSADGSSDGSSDEGSGDGSGDGAPVTGAGIARDAVPPAEATPADGMAPAEAAATDVQLLEKNGSGVSGEATVDADRVVATASGLDPEESYASFFYGATSSATNNNPCILDGTNPLPSGQTIGEWEVDENGNGTLSAANPLGELYGLQAGTMSIRQVQHDFSAATALPVNPLSYSLVACGEVERLEILDPVTDLLPKLPSVPSLPPLS